MMHQVRIEKLVNGGDGLGRWNDKAVFLPYTAPGDLVSFRPIKEKKRHVVGELLNVLEPAAERCVPTCQYFGDCGGCSWQFLPYAEQARWKEKIFAETLIFKTGVSPDIFSPIITADSLWGYRSRVQLKCRSTKDRQLLGFYRRASHTIVDIESCPLMPQQLNEALPVIRRVLASLSDSDCITQIDLSTDDEGSCRVFFHVADGFRDADRQCNNRLIESLIELAEEIGFSLFVKVGKRGLVEHLHGREALYVLPESLDCSGDPVGVRLGYGAGGFAQVHLQQNRNLVQKVIELAGLNGSERVLDLFCGMGNLTLPLARRGCSIVGVEESSLSIEWAKKNAEANNLEDRAQFFADKVERWLTGSRLMNVDLVLLDPPRSGAAEAAALLAESLVPKIVYVSCDPATLARDLATLIAGGYRIVSAVAADLFPQTSHIEGIVLLER